MNLNYRERNKYYSTQQIINLLCTTMRNREVIFMNADENHKIIRGLFISHPRYLKMFFNHYGILRKNENIYVSVAKYKHIPKFTDDLTQRSKETANWFHTKAKESIIEYDLLLDFDIENRNEYHELKKQVGSFVALLYKYKICFNVYSSGNGFHINIDSEGIHYNGLEKWEYIKQLTILIKERFDLNFLDLNGIGVYNKIRKCEYSIANNSICLPIIASNPQDKIFSYDKELYTPTNVLNMSMFSNNSGKYHDYKQSTKQKNWDNFRKLFFLDIEV